MNYHLSFELPSLFCHISEIASFLIQRLDVDKEMNVIGNALESFFKTPTDLMGLLIE